MCARDACDVRVLMYVLMGGVCVRYACDVYVLMGGVCVRDACDVRCVCDACTYKSIDTHTHVLI